MMEAAKIKLPFGLNENNILIHIADVKSGAKYNYFCPSCKCQLIAVKGKKNQHHFRHASDYECESGLESAIHLAAKQIIMEKRQIKIPEYIVTESAADSRGKTYSAERVIVEHNGRNVFFEEIQVEKKLHEMKADILAIKGNHQLIIEIFYRHKVDDLKVEKIKKSNLSSIEIDLSDLAPEDVKSMDTFWASINDSMRIRWLHNVKDNEEVHSALKMELADNIQKQEEEYQQEEFIRQKREQKEKEQFGFALAELNGFCSMENIKQLKQEAETHPAWKKHSKYLLVSLNKLPNFLNADVPDGDFIFGCDRRVWQTAFYDHFCVLKYGKRFCIKMVDKWLNDTGMCKTPDCAKLVGIYGRRYPELVPKNDSANLPSSWRTLKAFFWHLCDLGILEFTGYDHRNPGNEWFIIINKTPI